MAAAGGGGKNSEDRAVVVLEIDVHIHCRACERSVLRTLCKLKGVQKVSTDMNNNKAVVVGKVEPQKVLKKLRKKTGKRAEIVGAEEEKETGDEDDDDDDDDGRVNRRSAFHGLTPRFLVFDDPSMSDQIVLDLEMFSEENPLACTIM